MKWCALAACALVALPAWATSRFVLIPAAPIDAGGASATREWDGARDSHAAVESTGLEVEDARECGLERRDERATRRVIIARAAADGFDEPLLEPRPVSSAELASRGLVLLPSPGWTPELLDDLAAGLDALPPGARAFPGGPLEVALDDAPQPWGLGEPLLTDDLRRLRLSAFTEDDDARAASRLASLTAEQRRRLWRRRAVVHAVLRRWDERLRWSHRAAWRRLSGWRGGDVRLVYAWAFSRRAGMTSPALDLATFAEELLVPAESLADDAVRPDERVRCVDPSKARFLDERLHALDATWQPERDCPAFDEWAAVERVRGVEVLFAAPSVVSSQALFGHVLLRVVRDGDDVAAGGGQAMQLAALVSPFESRTSYVWRGLTGGFRGVFALSSMADVRHEALGLEQRSLRRFALELTAEQRVRLLERLWELERVGYLDYRFFTANCATMLRFLLEPVLEADAPGAPLTPWESPTQLLDALAPRLKPVGVEEASGVLALRARDALRALVAEAPESVRQTLGGAWERVAGVDDANDEERRAAYAVLAETSNAVGAATDRASGGRADATDDDGRVDMRRVASARDRSNARDATRDSTADDAGRVDATRGATARDTSDARDTARFSTEDNEGVVDSSRVGARHETPSGDASTALPLTPDGGQGSGALDWLARFALASLRRERFAVDDATARRIRMERSTLVPGWRGPTTDELVAARQRRFEAGTTRRVRAYDELTELLALDALLRAAPRRPLSPSEQAIVDAEAQARETFGAVAALVAALPEDALTRALEAERGEAARLDAELVARGVPEGGHGHAFLGGGVTTSAAPLARVRLAALFEQLGDQRWGGFNPRVGARLLDAQLELAFGPTPSVHRAGFTPVAVRTVSASGWGWGAGADWTYAAGAHELVASGEGLFALASNRRLTNYLLAVVGVRAGLHAQTDAQGLVAPRAGLEGRVQLPGSFANALRLEAAWTPRLLAGGGVTRFQQGASAHLSVVVRLGVVRRVALSLRADVEATWRAGERPMGQSTLGLTFD